MQVSGYHGCPENGRLKGSSSLAQCQLDIGITEGAVLIRTSSLFYQVVNNQRAGRSVISLILLGTAYPDAELLLLSFL